MAVALVQVEENPSDNSGVEELTLNSDESNAVNDLDLMFKDLEASIPSGAVVLESTDDHEEHLAAGAAVVNDELKAQAFAELDEQSSPLPDESVLPKATEKKKAPITKRISTMGLAKSVALANALGNKLDELLTVDQRDAALDSEQAFNKRLSLLEVIDKLPIKIGEKTTNLYAHVARGASLSNYTRIAIDLLVKNGELTSKTLKDAYMTRYSEGTAASQTTQMMKLLPTLSIATFTAGKLVPNENSTLLPMLKREQPAEVA